MIEKIDDRLVVLWHVLLGSARFDNRFLSVDEANAVLTQEGFSPLSDDEIKWWFDTAPKVVKGNEPDKPFVVLCENDRLALRQRFIQSLVFFGLSQNVRLSADEINILLQMAEFNDLSNREVLVYGLAGVKPFYSSNPFDLLSFARKLSDFYPIVKVRKQSDFINPAEARQWLILFLASYCHDVNKNLTLGALNKRLKKIGQKPLCRSERKLLGL